MRQFTKETIDYINLFESLTKSKIKDCFVNNIILFIVEDGYIGRAVGRKGRNVTMISRLIKKRIKLVEFNKSIEIFVKNLIYPIQGKIYKEDNLVCIELNKSSDKAIILGRDKKNLQELQNIVNKYFDIKIKVI